MRTHVKLFQDRFAELVRAGTKKQTIRRYPKRGRDVPEAGDRISCRKWLGRPRKSKQEILTVREVTHCHQVEIREDCLIIDTHSASLEPFAKADGFESGADMRDWFAKTHGLPFMGILILWE